METNIKANIKKLEGQIAIAAKKANRDMKSIRLLGACKTKPVDLINQALDMGLTLIGENKIQEAEDKFPQLNKKNIEKHFIGHLQSNKVKKAIELFDVIESVNSIKLAEKINSTTKKLNKIQTIFLEVNIGDEESKFGFKMNEIGPAIEHIKSLPNLNLTGLMCIPPHENNEQITRGYFKQMSALAKLYDLSELSMGMSSDFELAIEEGSTIIRVGTALFGKRDPPKQ